MRKALLLPALTALSAFLYSCNNNNGNTTVTPTGLDSLYGYMLSHHFITDSTFFMEAVDGQEAFAAFLTKPGDSTSFTLVDSVSVNSMLLEPLDDSTIYMGVGFPGPLDMSSTCNWKISGGSTMPSFTYNYPVVYPSYTGVIPDTISKSAGVTFNLSFSDADSVAISISGDLVNVYASKAFSPTATTQNFASSELTNVLTSAALNGLRAAVTVSAYRYNVQTFSGKNFLFSKVYEHTYWVWVQ